jgi:hypothetical protein
MIGMMMMVASIRNAKRNTKAAKKAAKARDIMAATQIVLGLPTTTMMVRYLESYATVNIKQDTKKAA